jgi:cell division protein FtsB
MDISGPLAFAVGFGVFLPAIIGYFSLQEKKVKLQQKLAEQNGGDMRRELDELRERVKVLERLVTDDDRRVSREIDRLSQGPHAGV